MTDVAENWKNAHRRALGSLAGCGQGADLEAYGRALEAAGDAFLDLVRSVAAAAPNAPELLGTGVDIDAEALADHVDTINNTLYDELFNGLLWHIRGAAEDVEAVERDREDAEYGSYEDQHRLTASELGLRKKS